MLDILDKMDKVVRVMAIIACVSALVLTILTLTGIGPLVKLFGHKVEYEEGTYTIDGYASSLLGYKFTTPENCMLNKGSDKPDLAKLVPVDSIREKVEDGTFALDLSASYTSGTSISVVAVFNEKYLNKKEKEQWEVYKSACEKMGLGNVEDGIETDLMGRKCLKFSTKIEGYIGNAILEQYVFIEDGFSWLITIANIEGREQEAEELLNAFSAYE